MSRLALAPHVADNEEQQAKKQAMMGVSDR
jgi:hypothetical protein